MIRAKTSRRCRVASSARARTRAFKMAALGKGKGGGGGEVTLGLPSEACHNCISSACECVRDDRMMDACQDCLSLPAIVAVAIEGGCAL